MKSTHSNLFPEKWHKEIVEEAEKNIKMKIKDPKQVKKGKKNRAAGSRFERKVRADLESKGWIVDKWSNNVEFEEFFANNNNPNEIIGIEFDKKNKGKLVEIKGYYKIGKLVPAKHKFRGMGIPMAMGTGFPDFIIFRRKTGKEILEDLKNAF